MNDKSEHHQIDYQNLIIVREISALRMTFKEKKNFIVKGEAASYFRLIDDDGEKESFWKRLFSNTSFAGAHIVPGMRPSYTKQHMDKLADYSRVFGEISKAYRIMSRDKLVFIHEDESKEI